MHDTPWMQDYSPSARGDCCTVVAMPVQVSVLPVEGGGSSPSPVVSDGCPLRLLLLVAVLRTAVLATVQVALLAAVQVVVLPVEGGGSSPSPATTDGCPLGLLLLVAMLAALLAAVQLVVLAAVKVAVLAAVQVAVLPVEGGGSSPSPAASDG
ncbi:hypothetical protein NDU88_003618 [Pleurodeles waltl]|uniref:Uncharacterized protein n=1 Tax=Pleurodeles waltl TaxID=8319 RepID=A0AAV7VG66_PLEWA|nr:hypothetical protein NDU88_003618 [Pleurodeles waltl]